MHSTLESIFDFITRHNVAVVVVLLVLTAGVGAGIPQLDLQSGSGASDVGSDTTVVQKSEYVQSAYRNETYQHSNTTTAVVYVRSENDNALSNGNALSKESLLATLRYQRAVTNNSSVAATSGRVFSVASLIGQRAAGSRDASLANQEAALEAASRSEVRSLVRETLREDSPALALLPADYEPGTAQAESHRIVFRLDGSDAQTSDATHALYEETTDDERLFTVGEHARAAQPDNAQLMNLLTLVVPFSLGAILLVLAFVYRDPIDVIVGLVGIVTSLVWMFGLIGWLGIPAFLSVVIAPVLIIGLSVDYGLHVFMRYREERGPAEGIRAPMARSSTALCSALALVTLTAAVGFLANTVTSLSSVKQLAYGITLGVCSAFLISMTLVPALKITLDTPFVWLGFDRRTAPLGKTRLLEPLLSRVARLASRAAPLVLIVGLVVGGLGAAAWSDLDRQAYVQSDGEVADWKKDLPAPVGWETTAYADDRRYVAENYRATEESERRRSSILIESGGGVATAGVLDRVAAVHDRVGEQSVAYTRGGSVPARSPLTVMRATAADDEEFAAVFRDADTDGDGVPDRNVERVFDALFAAAPEQATAVIDRTDDGYQSVRVVVPIAPEVSYPEQAQQMTDLASAVETDAVTVTAVDRSTVFAARGEVIADAILQTTLVGLLGVAVLLTLVYRLVVGSASLGLLTAVPIALVTTLVVGGMWILSVPLTTNTALLLSLVIGLGIDYTIHVSDRFAQEFEAGVSLEETLVTATTGTGGALLGSTLTTVAAFSAMLLAPIPVIQNFGTLVALALIASFVVAVVFVPALVTVWHRYVPGTDSPTIQSTPVHDD